MIAHRAHQGKKAFPMALKPVLDPVWMLLFMFFRLWCPLSGKQIIITFGYDTRYLFSLVA